MKQHSIHAEMIKQVAKRLGPLRHKVVFLGGSATGFHITDKAEPEIRTTKDVDIIVEVASRADYHRLEKTLREFSNFRLGNCIAFAEKNRKINGLSHFFT
jgi:hypothetical protein